MPFEDHIRSTVDAAIEELKSRIEREVRAIADRLVAGADDDRQQTLVEARRTALAEAAEETRRQVEEAENRVRQTIDAVVAEARQQERQQSAIDVRRIVEIEAEQKLGEELANAEQRMKLALTDAETKAEQALKDSVSAARVREREFEMAAVTRLLDSVRGLDGASSLSEVLDALGLAAGRRRGRAHCRAGV